MENNENHSQLSSDTSCRRIKIGALNVNSLVANYRRHCLQKFLDEHQFDVLLISETKLKKIHSPQFKGYSIVRTDRLNKGGGGTAILIADAIQFAAISKPNAEKNKNLEFIAIKLFPKEKTPILVFSIYAPTGNSSTFIKEHEELYDNFNLGNNIHRYIIAGDFNARNSIWGDSSTNLRGAQLEAWEQESTNVFRIYMYSPISPTYPAASLYLDHCITDPDTKIINHINGKLQTLPHDSDHNAIVFIIEISQKSHDTPIINHHNYNYNYKKTKWKKFTEHLSRSHGKINRPPEDRNLTIEEIDEHLLAIENIIKETIKDKIPKFKPGPKDGALKFVNNRIKKLHTNKSRLITLLHEKYSLPRTYETLNNIKGTKRLIKLINLELDKEF